MICSQCGQALPEGAYFCQKCGAEAKPEAAPTGPAAGAPIQQAQTSGLAIGSLICGLFSLFVLPGIAAVVMGHVALSKIKQSAGRIGGRGVAIAGLVLGYLGLAFVPVTLIIAALAIPNLLRARMAANESSAMSSVRTISTAEISYQASFEKGFAPDLASLGGGPGCDPSPARACIIDSELAMASGPGSKNGYVFSAQGSEDGAQYLVTARPSVPNTTGRRSFCSTEDGVVRVDTSGGTISSREDCLALPDVSR
jgi:type II secretory pathway pseudopilin PulG